MSSLVRTSGIAEQLYIKVESLELPAVWWQHLSRNGSGYKSDLLKQEMNKYLKYEQVCVHLVTFI